MSYLSSFEFYMRWVIAGVTVAVIAWSSNSSGSNQYKMEWQIMRVCSLSKII